MEDLGFLSASIDDVTGRFLDILGVFSFFLNGAFSSRLYIYLQKGSSL